MLLVQCRMLVTSLQSCSRIQYKLVIKDFDELTADPTKLQFAKLVNLGR